MRKEKTLVIDDRGNKLTFKIQEMPATRLMDWIAKALLLLAQAGADVPTGAGLDAAVKYFADNGFKALGALDYAKAKPLMEELLGCCYRQTGNAEERVTTATADAYIEDVATLFRLEMEAFALHFDFFQNAAPSDTPAPVSIARPRRDSGALRTTPM